MPSTNRRNRSCSPAAVIERSQSRRQQHNTPDCKICRRDHPLRTCQKFNKMTVTSRYRVVQKYKYCQNCLAHSHLLARCRSSERCRKCQQRHHTLLHHNERIRPIRNRQILRNQEVPLQSIVLRPTVLIRLKLGDTWGNVRGVLSPSSETTKIAEFIPTRYHLPIERSGLKRIRNLNLLALFFTIIFVVKKNCILQMYFIEF